MNNKTANFLVERAKVLMSSVNPAHSVTHLDSVWKNAKHINSKLKVGVDESLLKVARYWHDISYSIHGFNVVQYFF